jgi:hypothetical protein
MFDTELNKYKTNGTFSFKPSESLKDKCNAPINQSGIYLIYKIIDEEEILIYIGSSGQKKSDGTLKNRKGGMKDRLVNGYHPNRFGEIKRIKRHKAFPQQMQKEDIAELKFYWWVTYDNNISDFPTDVETILREIYRSKFQKLPDWHS